MTPLYVTCWKPPINMYTSTVLLWCDIDCVKRDVGKAGEEGDIVSVLNSQSVLRNDVTLYCLARLV